AAIVHATGAEYIAVHSIPRLLHDVRQAFYIARMQSRPVVLGVPYDLQKRQISTVQAYRPSTDIIPLPLAVPPHPNSVAAAAALIGKAERIVIVGGRGVQLSDAREACRELASACNALLATTLLA